MKHTVLLLGALFVVLICPSFLTAGEHQRDSWYIGFGIGAGFDEAWYVDGKKVTFEDWHGLSDGNVTAALNFKAGGTFSPKLLLGFDLTSIGESSTNGYTDRFCSIDNYFLMLTYFPWEEGFFRESVAESRICTWRRISALIPSRDLLTAMGSSLAWDMPSGSAKASTSR